MYLRLTLLGNATNGERWSVNPIYDPEGEIQNSWNQANGDLMAAAAANVVPPAQLLSLMSSTLTITGVRLEGRHNSTDELLGVSEFLHTTPIVGTGTLRLPLQAAVVISLRTDTPGGRGRGRLYWPACGATLSTAGRLSSPTETVVVGAAQTYLRGISDAMDASVPPDPLTSIHLAVRSRTAKTTPHVNRLQVGDVVDTQRRRRDALPENYANAVYPGP